MLSEIDRKAHIEDLYALFTNLKSLRDSLDSESVAVKFLDEIILLRAEVEKLKISNEQKDT